MLRYGLLLLVAFVFLPDSARAELRWDTPRQSFHRSPTERQVETKFAFRNVGQKRITIRKIRTSCDCTTATVARDTFAPGEQGEIAVQFVFGDRKGKQRKVIAVETSDQAAPAYLNFDVWIHEPLTVTPVLVYWKINEALTTKSVQLDVEPGTVLHARSVNSSNPAIAAKLETINDGEQYTVAVTPSDTRRKDAATIIVETDFPPDRPRAYTIHARIK